MYIGLPSLALRSSSAGFSPASLFAAGEQGGWYDPSDISTMYQDSTAQTPAALESPVGLLLDKRLGLVTTPVTVSSWVNNGYTTFNNTGSSVTFATASSSFTSATVSPFLPTTVVGQVYQVVADVTLTSGSFTFYIGTSGSAFSANYSVTSSGRKTFLLVVTAASATIGLAVQSGNPVSATINIISMGLVQGNHLTQATAASRPTLSARYNTATKTELLTDVAWSTGGGSVAVTGGVSDPRGGLLAFTLTGTGGAQNFWQPTASTGKTTQYKIWIRRRTGTGVINLWNTDNGSNTNIGPSLTSSWQLFSSTPTVQAATGVQFTFGTLGDAIDVAFPDVRTSADWALNIPAYQRVDTATSYDTSGFPMYLNFDGVDDKLNCSLAVAGSLPNATDSYHAVQRGSTANALLAYNNNTTGYWNVYDGTAVANSSAVGAPTTVVNGVALGDSLRSTLSTAFPVSTSKLIESQGLDLSSGAIWTDLSMGSYPSFVFNGRLYGWILSPTKPNATRAKVRTYLGSKMGVAL